MRGSRRSAVWLVLALPLVLGGAGPVRAGDFLELRPEGARATLRVDLVRRQAWAGERCAEPTRIRGLQQDGDDWRGHLRRSGKLSLPGRTIPYRERVRIRVEAGRGELRILHSLASEEVVLPFEVVELKEPPCP